MIRQAVDNDEALAVLDVQISHAGELLGAGRVQDLEDAGRVVHLDLLPVEILDGRVVLLHEAARHELDCQGTLTHTAGAQHHYFEFPHGCLRVELCKLPK